MELLKNITVLPLLVSFIAFVVYTIEGDTSGMFIFGMTIIALYLFIKD